MAQLSHELQALVAIALAAQVGRLALVRCTDTRNGEECTLLALTDTETPDGTAATPVARIMLDHEPYRPIVGEDGKARMMQLKAIMSAPAFDLVAETIN